MKDSFAMPNPGPKRPEATELQMVLCERVRVLRDREAEEAYQRRVELAAAIREAKASGLSWRHMEQLCGIRHQTMQKIISGPSGQPANPS